MPNLSQSAYSISAKLGLVSAALMLSGCSFLGLNSHSNSHQGYHQASTPTGYSAPVASTSYHQSAPVATTHSYSSGTSYAQSTPTTLSANAPYGSAVAYNAPTTNRALRGPFTPYKYGSVGGVLYDLGNGAAGIQGRLGYQATRNFGLEGEGSLGIVSGNAEFGGTELKNGVDYSGAAFATAKMQLTPRWSVHGRGGYHLTGVEQESLNGNTLLRNNNTEDGLAFGGGVEMAISAQDALRLDYTNYAVSGDNLDAVSLAYQRRF